MNDECQYATLSSEENNILQCNSVYDFSEVSPHWSGAYIQVNGYRISKYKQLQNSYNFVKNFIRSELLRIYLDIPVNQQSVKSAELRIIGGHS